jgi:hypothetical protein
MAIKLTPGNLYFIRDIDYLTGEIGKYVKIGIVTNDRKTEDRLKDHQTGNPRGIYPVAEVTNVPFVERLETQLHYEHNEKWIAGEWFLLDDKEVKAIVKRAEALKTQQLSEKPLLEEVLLKIQKKPSNGKIKKADKKALDLEKNIIQLKGELNVLKAKIEISKYEFYTLLGANGTIDGVLRIKYSPSSLKFDEKAFEAAHPSIYNKFILPREDTFKHTFNYTNSSSYSLKVVNPTVHSIFSALGKTTYTKAQLSGTQKRTKKIEQLHADHLILLKKFKEREYKLEILEYQLQKVVGAYDGIQDICAWKREFVPQSPAFNTTAFKEKHPKLYDSFVTKPSNEGFAMEVEKSRAYKPK